MLEQLLQHLNLLADGRKKVILRNVLVFDWFVWRSEDLLFFTCHLHSIVTTGLLQLVTMDCHVCFLIIKSFFN